MHVNEEEAEEDLCWSHSGEICNAFLLFANNKLPSNRQAVGLCFVGAMQSEFVCPLNSLRF